MEKPAVGGSQCWFPFKRAYNKRRRNWPDSFDDNQYQETNPVACVFGRKGQHGTRDDYDVSLFGYDGAGDSQHVGETELVLDGKIPVPRKNTEKGMPMRDAAKSRPYMIPARTELKPDDTVGSLPRALATIEANPLSTAFWTDEVAANGALCLQPSATMDVGSEWRRFSQSGPETPFKQVSSITRSERKEADSEGCRNRWLDDGVSTDMVILKEVPHDPEIKSERPKFSDDQIESCHDDDSLVEEIRTSLVDASLDASILKMEALNQDSRNPNLLHQRGSSPSDGLHPVADRKQSSSMLDIGIGTCGFDFSLLTDQKLLSNGFHPKQTRNTLCRLDTQCEDYPEPAFSIEVEPLMESDRESPPRRDESSPVTSGMSKANADGIPSDSKVLPGEQADVDLPLLSANEDIDEKNEMENSNAVAVSADESSSIGGPSADNILPSEVGQQKQRTISRMDDGAIQDDAPSSPGNGDRGIASKGMHSPARNSVRKASSMSRAMSENVLRARSKGGSNSKPGGNIESTQQSNEIVSEDFDRDPYLEELDRVISSIDKEGADQPRRDPAEVAGYEARPHCMSLSRLEASVGRFQRAPADSLTPYQPRKTRSEMPLPKSLSMKGFIGRSRSGIEPKTSKCQLVADSENDLGAASNVQPPMVEVSSALPESNDNLAELASSKPSQRSVTPTKPKEKKFAISGVPTDIKIPRRRTSMEKLSTKTPPVIFAPARNGANSFPAGLKYSSKAGSSRRSKTRSRRQDGFESEDDSLFSDLNSFGSSSGYTRGVESEVTTFTEFQQEGTFACMDGWIG